MIEQTTKYRSTPEHQLKSMDHGQLIERLRTLSNKRPGTQGYKREKIDEELTTIKNRLVAEHGYEVEDVRDVYDH